MWTPLVRTGGDFLTSALSGEGLSGLIFKASGKINMIGLAHGGHCPLWQLHWPHVAAERLRSMAGWSVERISKA